MFISRMIEWRLARQNVKSSYTLYNCVTNNVKRYLTPRETNTIVINHVYY